MGALMLYKPDGSDTIDPAFKDEDGAFTAVSVNLVTYAYNTQHVAPADVPKSALDFLKPIFTGKLITTDPSDDDAALITYKGIVDKYGWDYMDKYIGQKPALRARRPRHGVERHRFGRDAGDVRFDLDHAAPDRGRQADPTGVVGA